jgi:hypothetical protein
MRRVFGLILVGLGTALLVLAPMVKFYAVPRLTVAPLNLNVKDTSNRSGTAAVVADLATGTEKENVPLVAVRRTTADVAASQQASSQTGTNSGVYDSLQVVSLASDTSGKPYLPATPERYAFDRTTSVMQAVAGANVGGVAITPEMVQGGVILPFKMPFSTEKKTYSVFDSTLMKGVDTTFVSEESVQGLSTYKFTSSVPAVKSGMQGTSEVWYQDEQTIWVEPSTGQIVNGTNKIKQWLKNPDGTDGLVVIDGTLGFTDQELASSVESAKANASKLNLVSNVLPVVSLVLGAVALLGGILLLRRRDDAV